MEYLLEIFAAMEYHSRDHAVWRMSLPAHSGNPVMPGWIPNKNIRE